MQAPTYQEFRTCAYVNAHTTERLAPYVQSDSPEKAAKRILIHLAGIRLDDEPLPYPKLCQLYYGEVASTTAAVSPLTPDEETAWIECQFKT